MDEIKIPQELDNGIRIIGDEWILCIITALAKQGLRYCEILRTVKNINPATLSNRLKRLEELGFVERSEETVDKLSVVYDLTKKGKGILPVIDEIHKFSQKYLAK